jgi:DNA-binding HxlR family transcriptional regulator
MRSYGQYCPVARGAEVFAERWTLIIMRNILYGCRTFNEIAAGAPGLSRALLTRRLRELKRAGIIEILAKPNGRGSLYEPTEAGHALESVITALGVWGDQWMDVRPEHSDPVVALWSWCQVYLRRDLLPERRVVVRFDFRYRSRPEVAWLLVERGDAELCAFDPGFGEDVVVTINDPLTFARWHLGHIPWATALRSGGVSVTGPRELVRALPTWNQRPEIGIQLRASRSTAR